jgi:hypothetical protein
MAKHEIFEKPIEYLSLATLLTLSFLIFIFLPLDVHQKRWLVSFTAVGYFLWSLYHHYHRGDLHPSIVVEYLLILALGIIFISTTLL